MAILNILKMGNPTLRKIANHLSNEEILSNATKKLIDDMYDTMKKANGIGIAAPQVGVSKQLAIIELTKDNPRYQIQGESEKFIIFNPSVTILDSTLQGYWEGCLSVPNLKGFVERPKKIKINYQDEFAEKKELILEGFLATVFQHELDHLFGKLYIDSLKDTTLLAFDNEFHTYWKNS